MILIEENYDSNNAEQVFNNPYRKYYQSCYYRDKKAKEKNEKSWFKYITSIVRRWDGTIEIRGNVGRRTFLWYSMKNAITKYNKECKERMKN